MNNILKSENTDNLSLLSLFELCVVYFLNIFCIPMLVMGYTSGITKTKICM